jgi:hypothetical protein
MSGLHCMGPYLLSFVAHDAGANLLHLLLDCPCWIMLVNFPIDYLSAQYISKAVSSFGNLLHWHRSSNLARQIVLVNVYSSARIPYSIVVAVGDEPYAHCWSVTCFLLSESLLPLHADPDPVPPFGHTPHPLPPPPLCWLGNGEQAPRHGRGKTRMALVQVAMITGRPRFRKWCSTINRWTNQLL